MKEDPRMEKPEFFFIKNCIIKNVYYLDSRAALHKPRFP